jgi:hypothetical protein
MVRKTDRNEEQMTMDTFRKSIADGSAALILGGLLVIGCSASAANAQKKPAAPAPKAAAAPKSGGSAAGGARPGGSANGAASHGGPTANGAAATHGPSANGGTHGPTANGAGAQHGATTTGGAHPGGAAGGATHPGGAAGGARPGGGASAGHPGASGGGKASPIKSGAAPKGSSEKVTKSGSAVRTRPGGKVSDVHDAKRGMDTHNNLGGGRRVSVQRHDGSRMVSERGRRGYVERGYSYHGHDFARRSYFYHGHEYNRFYRGYGYRGLMLNVYAPGFYYGAGFYGWAYNPWAAPIAFGWGWGGNPWFGFYGGYFQPYPVYPSAAFWLTDYIISQDLQAAYAAHQEAQEEAGAPPAPGGAPALTPEVKQMIADEVRNQLALENQEATQNAASQDVDPGSSGIARLLSDGHPHVFVAGGNLDVTDTSGQECVVSDGDTLQLRDAPAADATSANLVILSSKGNPECQISLTVQVQLTDLQEMQNHMRETIDQGLKDLQDKQGTGGLPAAPPSAAAPPVQSQYAAVAPPPEANVGADIQAQDQQAAASEKDVTAEAAQDSGGAAPPAGAADAAPAAPAAAPAPASVELGQSIDQVQAALGTPTRIANLGVKVIYYYNGMKVTFKDGKVSDVQ